MKITRETQKNFDIEKYLGKWYEIARYDFVFQRDCSFSEAEYTWNAEENVMNIKNTCLDSQRNPIRDSEGRGRIPDMNDKSKLKVLFFGPEAWKQEGDYWVFYTDYDKYSIVGDANGRFLWILSREKTIPKEDVTMLIQKVKSFGFDESKLMSKRELLY